MQKVQIQTNESQKESFFSAYSTTVDTILELAITDFDNNFGTVKKLMMENVARKQGFFAEMNISDDQKQEQFIQQLIGNKKYQQLAQLAKIYAFARDTLTQLV